MVWPGGISRSACQTRCWKAVPECPVAVQALLWLVDQADDGRHLLLECLFVTAQVGLGKLILQLLSNSAGSSPSKMAQMPAGFGPTEWHPGCTGQWQSG
jgi:hypothetical protein